jgi:multidrug resistance efflux pump
MSLMAVVLTVILMIFWQPRIRVHSTGAVDAPTHIVYAPESGFISQLAFDNQRELTGQKNQPLLTLNSYELELAGIELRSAENMLIMQQQESLSADDTIESQRLRIEQSLLNEKLLSLNKQYTSLEIQKPEGDWLVDSMPKQSLLGRYFGSGQPILTLVAKKKRFIDVVVDQRDVYLITQGDRGLIRFRGVGPAIYDAHIESISPVAKLDGIEQSLIVRMSIMTDNNLQTPPLGLSGDVMILGQPTPLFMHFVHTIRKILRADLWL